MQTPSPTPRSQGTEPVLSCSISDSLVQVFRGFSLRNISGNLQHFDVFRIYCKDISPLCNCSVKHFKCFAEQLHRGEIHLGQLKRHLGQLKRMPDNLHKMMLKLSNGQPKFYCKSHLFSKLLNLAQPINHLNV